MTAPLRTEQRLHDIKAIPMFFEKLVDGTKTFEIRQNDRDYRVGDKLRIREWNPRSMEYTGREVGRVVTYLTDFMQGRNVVVMGIR